MTLVSLVYCSTVAANIDMKNTREIYQLSRIKNKTNSITGLLCFNSKYFLQIIEGNGLAISDLYNKIINDPRHEKCYLMNLCNIEKRNFSDWSMGHVNLEKQKESLILKYSATKDFNPYNMIASSAYNLLLELRSLTKTQIE